jgi:hypothetical protein
LKVKAAGFRIFRQRRVHPIVGNAPVKNSIWELSDKGSWCKYQDYESKAAMERAWRDLMKDSKNIGEGEEEQGGQIHG